MTPKFNIDKNFDSSSKEIGVKIFGADGNVVSDPVAVRRELVEGLLTSMQSSLHSNLSGDSFKSNVDLIGNELHKIDSYVDSLKIAVGEILVNHPIQDDADTFLKDIVDLCDVMVEGTNRVNEYLETVKGFSSNIDSIRSELYSKMKALYGEF